MAPFVCVVRARWSGTLCSSATYWTSAVDVAIKTLRLLHQVGRGGILFPSGPVSAGFPPLEKLDAEISPGWQTELPPDHNARLRLRLVLLRSHMCANVHVSSVGTNRSCSNGDNNEVNNKAPLFSSILCL